MLENKNRIRDACHSLELLFNTRGFLSLPQKKLTNVHWKFVQLSAYRIVIQRRKSTEQDTRNIMSSADRFLDKSSLLQAEEVRISSNS